MYQRINRTDQITQPIDWSSLRVDLHSAVAPFGLVVGNVAPTPQPHSVRLTMNWSFGGGLPMERDIRIDGSLGDALSLHGSHKTFIDSLFHIALAKAGLHPMPEPISTTHPQLLGQLETVLRELVTGGPLLQLVGIKIPTVVLDDAGKVLKLIDSGAIHANMTIEETLAAVKEVSSVFGITLPGLLDTALVAAEHVEASISSIEHGQYALLGSGDVPLPTKSHEPCILLLCSKRSDIAGVVYGTKQITDVPA